MIPRRTWTACFQATYERGCRGTRMNISRRIFLGGVTGCAATLWSFDPIGLDMPGSEPERGIDCVLLDLNSDCILRESLQGYQAALNLFPKATLNSRRRCRLAIVP